MPAISVFETWTRFRYQNRTTLRQSENYGLFDHAKITSRSHRQVLRKQNLLRNNNE